MAECNYWLFKTEAEVYSIDDLQRDGSTCWDGVRNYQARNMLRDDIKIGDQVFVYHSNAEEPAIVGIAEVIRQGYPDHTQFEAGHAKFDPKATSDKARWYMVDIAFKEKFNRPLTLKSLRAIEELMGMELLRKGSRLSVQPVRKSEWKLIQALRKKQR